MKRGLKVWLLVALVLISLWFVESVDAETNVSSCGTLNTANEIYTQNISITPDNGEYCILINADNITFNGNAYSIFNTTYDGSAIKISGVYNITIENTNISVSKTALTSYPYGIYARDGVTNSVFRNNTISGCRINMRIKDTNDSLIVNNTLSNAGTLSSIYIDGYSNGLSITNNAISDNGDFSIKVVATTISDLLIEENDFDSNTDDIVYISNPSQNTNIKSNVFENTNFGPGDYIIYAVNSTNMNIYNNTFRNNTASSHSGETTIKLSGGTNIQVYNNTIGPDNLNYYTIGIMDDVNNSKIYDNNITCGSKEFGSHGIVFRKTYDNTAYGNTIKNCSFGILFHNGSNENTFHDMNVDECTIGFYIIDEAVNNTAYDINITNGGTGVYFYHYPTSGNLYPSNNTLYDIVINNSLNYGLRYTNCSNDLNTIKDTVINNSGVYDIYILNTTNKVFLNVTYDITKEQVDSNSELIRKWYYRAYVNDTGGNNVSGVNVTAYNASGDYQFNLTTDSTGYTSLGEIIDYVNNGGTKTYYSKYTIYASDSSYVTAIHEKNITELTNIYNDVFTLTFPITASEETTPSAGGGYPTYKPTQEQLEKGYEKSLRKNWKIQFKFNNESHTIKLDGIINKTAIITVSSEPVTFNLTISETKKLNLDDDNYYDLQIFLKDISDYEADLVVKLILEKIPCEPDWKCGNWDECVNYTQTRICTDLNNCNTTEGKPDEVKGCCEPNWNCSEWSECINDKQTRICTDLNDCNVTEGKPDEVGECEPEADYLNIVIISLLIVAIVIAGFLVRKQI